MSDARWFEIAADVAAATLHFRRSMELFEAGGFEGDGLGPYTARMAFMHAMQSGHTSLETALVRILELMGEEPPSGRDWHADLITRVSRAADGRPAILDGALAAAADETRRFRHVAMRSYGSLQVDRARPAVMAAAVLACDLAGGIDGFRGLLDPDG